MGRRRGAKTLTFLARLFSEKTQGNCCSHGVGVVVWRRRRCPAKTFTLIISLLLLKIFT